MVELPQNQVGNTSFGKITVVKQVGATITGKHFLKRRLVNNIIKSEKRSLQYMLLAPGAKNRFFFTNVVRYFWGWTGPTFGVQFKFNSQIKI